MADYDGGSASVRIRPNMGRFSTDLQAELRRVQASLEVNAKVGRIDDSQLVAWRARQQANAVNVPVRADTSAADRAINALSSRSRGLSGTEIKIAVGLLGIDPAIASLGALSSAIVQVSQAGLALPGVFAGTVSSIGTFAVGVSGVKDAYDAAGKAAEDSGRTQQSTARANESAQRAQSSAVRDEARAQEDVIRARRDALHTLQDLNLELRGSAISEAQARLDLRRSVERLQSGQFTSATDAEQALLDVQANAQRLDEVLANNAQLAEKVNDANAKGVENADVVVAANDRLAQSHDQVAAAQAAVTDAAGKTSVAASAADQALAKLSPNQREFVETLIGAKPRIQEFRQSIAEPLFDGLSPSLRNLLDRTLPTLSRGMGGIAGGLNDNIKTLFASIGSDQGQGILDRILGNTADAQQRASRAIDPLVRAVGTLAAAGTDSLPRLSDALADVSERIANTIEQADREGRLHELIDEGITGLGHVLSIAKDLGDSFVSIGRAAGGQGLLGTIDSLTGRMAAFLRSPQGQDQVREFFDNAKESAAQWIPVLQQLPGFIQGVIDAGRDIGSVVVPILADVSKILGEHPDLIKAVILAFGGFKTITAISDLATSLRNISGLLGSPGKGRGRGGAGILGKLALLAGGTVLLGDALSDDGNQDPAPGPPPSPDTPHPNAPANSGQIDPGQLPAGQPVPFEGIGAPVIPPAAAGQVAANAGLGAATLGPWGTVPGALLGVPDMPAEKRTKAEQDFDQILNAIPKLNDANLKPYADILGMSVQDLRSISRDDLYKRFMTMAAQPGSGYKTGGHVPGGATTPVPAILHGREFVQQASAVAKYGVPFMTALNEGRIDPKSLPHFQNGGLVDLFSPANTNLALNNPAAPQTALHAGSGAPPGPATSADGGLPLDRGWPGGQAPIGLGGGPDGFDIRKFGIGPGPAGSGPNDWMNFAGKTLGDFAGNFVSTLSHGILGGLGLDGILNSPYWAGATGLLGHFLNPGKDGSSASSSSTVPGGDAMQTMTLGDGTVVQIPNTAASIASSSGAGPAGGISPLLAGKLFNGGSQGKDVLQNLSPAALRAIDYAQKHAKGQKYDYGGAGEPGRGYDCSGIASAIYNAATGRNVRFNTESDFEALGFVPGNKPGALNIGVSRNGGGRNSHMVVTLPNGVNVESGGAHNSTSYGGPAKGASQMPLHWYLPLPPGFADGGPTPAGRTRAFPAILHGDEYVISARGRATVPDSFLHALNRGLVDPKALPGFAEGGSTRRSAAELRALQAFAMNPNPPRPNFDPGEGARIMTPSRLTPRQQTPQAASTAPPQPYAPPAPAQPPPTAVAGAASPGQAPAQQQPTQPVVAPPPASTEHLLPAAQKAITSTATAVGNAAATAAAAFGGGTGGGAGSLIQGAAAQAGKIATNVAEVFAAMNVGTLTTDPTAAAYGRTEHPAQQQPDTWSAGGGFGTHIGAIYGHDMRDVVRQMDTREAQQNQGYFANQ